MQSCKSLQHVSLRRSHIGDEGCQLICHATKLLTNIQSVDLSSCGITAGGVLAVVEMVKVSCCMWSVQLWFLHQYSLTCNTAIRLLSVSLHQCWTPWLWLATEWLDDRRGLWGRMVEGKLNDLREVCGGGGCWSMCLFWWFIRGSCNWSTALGDNTVSRRLC